MAGTLPDRLQVEIVTPSMCVLSGEAGGLTIPGVCGDYGVLPGHVPLITELNAGVVTLVPPHQSLATCANPTRYFVSGGFVEVRAGSCVILTEDSDLLERLGTQESLRQQLEDIDNQCLESPEKASSVTVMARKSALEARLRVALALTSAPNAKHGSTS